MKIYFSILLLFLTICQTQSFAQSQKRLIKKAKKLELAGNLDQAAIFYEEASTNFSQTSTNGGCHNHGYLSFKAAECYRLTNQDTLAMFNYEKALLLNYADVEPKTLLYLGDYYCEQGECSKAINYFNKYKLIVPNDTLMDGKINGCRCPIFVDLWVTFSVNYDLTKKIEVRVSGTDGLDTLITVTDVEGFKLQAGIIKVGYDYTIEILSNSERLGNKDKFTTKNITESRRIIREISILEGCRLGYIFDNSILIDLHLVLVSLETGEVVPNTEIVIKSKKGERFVFITDEKGEITITVDENGERILKPNQKYEIHTCELRESFLDGYDYFDTYNLTKSVRIIREIIWTECD